MSQDSIADGLLRGMPPDSALHSIVVSHREVLEDICNQLFSLAARLGHEYRIGPAWKIPAVQSELEAIGIRSGTAVGNHVTLEVAADEGWSRRMTFSKDGSGDPPGSDDSPTEVQMSKALDQNAHLILDFPPEHGRSVVLRRLRDRFRFGPPNWSNLQARLRQGPVLDVPSCRRKRLVEPHWEVSGEWNAADWRVSLRTPLTKRLCELIDPKNAHAYTPPERFTTLNHVNL